MDNLKDALRQSRAYAIIAVLSLAAALWTPATRDTTRHQTQRSAPSVQPAMHTE